MEAGRLRHRITLQPHEGDREEFTLEAEYVRFAELRGQTALERQTADANHGNDLKQMKVRYDSVTKYIRNSWMVVDEDAIRYRVAGARDPDGRKREIVCVLVRD